MKRKIKVSARGKGKGVTLSFKTMRDYLKFRILVKEYNKYSDFAEMYNK